MSDQVYHVPVLLNEVIEGLHINPDGIYVDCTFGGGGHSKAILSKLGTKGKLIAFDQDDDAKNNLPDDERLVFVSHNFRHLQRFLKLEGITTVDGIMADLGVSSHQFNEAERGFSIRFNAELDMRMDQRQTLTAFDVVQTYTEQQLHKLFEQYGEVTNSKTLAKTIVQVRNNASLKTIDGFKNAFAPPKSGGRGRKKTSDSKASVENADLDRKGNLTTKNSAEDQNEESKTIQSNTPLKGKRS